MAEFVEVVFKVEPHHSGLRLDEFMKARLSRYSRNEIHNIIETRLVRKDRKLKKATIVKAGDEVIFLYPKKEDAIEDIDIPVLYEDEYLLIVDKPPLMSVHSTNPWGKNDLIQQLRRQRNSRDLYLAHRIDRETSGIVIVTKSADISRILGNAFAGSDVEKEYTAIVFGEMKDEEGVIDLPICRDEKSAVKIKMTATHGMGVPSKTKYVVLNRFKGFTMAKAMPRTGRQHQIRVHFSAIGHPLVGDKIYKDEKLFLEFIQNDFTEEMQRELLLPRHALHASRISFNHPKTGIKIEIEAELSEDLRTFLNNAAQHT